MVFWGLISILGLAAAGACSAACQTQAHARSRRQMMEQCLPRSREEAEFFARYWTAGRTRH